MLVFEEFSIAGIQFKNRIIRSATHEGMADNNGFPTEGLKKLYVRLARGGVGAIITGYAGIQADGKSSMRAMTMIDKDEHINAYRKITDAVHEYGTPIIMQIAHCGRQTRSKITGLPIVAPSAIRDKYFSEDLPAQLSEHEIEDIISNFVSAIIRAKKAGFDGVQLHAAHGYLLTQFLSPYSNRRKDSWGGSLENRFRIIDEILKRSRRELPDYPILAKISAYDGRKGGIRIEEALQTAKMLQNSGCAAIEVSCGVIEDGFYTMRGEKMPVDPIMHYFFKFHKTPVLFKTLLKPFISAFSALPKPLLKYNLEAAIEISKRVTVPVIVVGGFNNLKDIGSAVERENIDCVSMCRPFIAEPDIVEKFQKGIRSKSICTMCNYCIIIGEKMPLKCYLGKMPSA